ncbi:MAG TPA: hypothetical protein VGE29_15360 [Prosthecobacter sp.]
MFLLSEAVGFPGQGEAAGSAELMGYLLKAVVPETAGNGYSITFQEAAGYGQQL